MHRTQITGNRTRLLADPDPIESFKAILKCHHNKTTAESSTTTDPTRLAMLARVKRGELDHSAAAKELGLSPGVWGLWRARQAKVQGKKPVAKKAARKSGRGRRADPAETARRVATIERVQAGELNNAAAANALGIRVGARGVWRNGRSSPSGPEAGATRELIGVPWEE